MIITIDPKQLRERFNLIAGTQLEIEAVGDGLKLRKVVSEPTLIRKKGFLVHHGVTPAAIDIVEFIGAEREARSRHIAAADSD